MIRVNNTSTTKKPNSYVRGFALPTILISSIVMLIVLLVSVSSTTAVRTAMKNQYYTQLAQAAGEAGVAYAQACLNANQGVPQWSNASPLKSNTDCSGVETVTCPTTSVNALCSVSRNGNVRSNFSVGLPELDADGKAIKIPNTGYVEVLRTSNSAVWRKYDQKSTPMVAVPDLCSGSAKSILGWNNAVTGYNYTHPEPTAQSISNSTTTSNVGPMYFRKDFSVAKEGTYTLSHISDNVGEAYVDGKLVSVSTYPTLASTNMYLDVGCHSVQIKVTNTGILANPSGLKFSLKLADTASPIVVSDKTWRVTSGSPKHYSEVDYYADPASWTAVRVIQTAEETVAGWGSISGSVGARWISTTHSYDGSGNYPSNQFALFRDNRDVYVSANTTVKVTYLCNTTCYPYIDGQLISTSVSWSNISTFTVTLAAGYHKFAFMGFNSSGASGFAFSAVTDGGTVLSTSDGTWSATNFWTATNPTSTYSYDNTYVPTLDRGKVNVLVVAGGGSGGGSTGGGGGGGGVIETTQALEAKSYSVTVGAGGAIPGNQATGLNGANSLFNGLVAIGGGGGGYSSSALGTSGGGLNGGSGGGGQTYSMPKSSGHGILLQGNPGGPLGYLSGSGGGGAAAAGTIGQSSYTGGTGGPGRASSITGSLQYYSGGGGGGGNTGGAGGIGGGGAGADCSLGTNGTSNTGGGGGGGWCYATGNGGAGGSGVVIISYPTGLLSATGGAVTTSGGYTIHTFTASGTFAVSTID